MATLVDICFVISRISLPSLESIKKHISQIETTRNTFVGTIARGDTCKYWY